MESRLFIRVVADLIPRIQANPANEQSTDSKVAEGIQKEINQTFQGLQNPTLPSAGKLHFEALAAGYQVDQRVTNRLQQAETCWQ